MKTEEEHLDEFQAYCRQMSDRQIRGVVEREDASTDPSRKPYQRVARAEAERRGVWV